jgi:RNA polymerase II subunit A-like phosphatase
MLYDARVSTDTTPITMPGFIYFFAQIIIPGLRLQTFDGLHILFSSVIPLDTRPESTDIWNLAEAFGASCHTELSSEVTHLVAAKVLPLFLSIALY